MALDAEFLRGYQDHQTADAFESDVVDQIIVRAEQGTSTQLDDVIAGANQQDYPKANYTLGRVAAHEYQGFVEEPETQPDANKSDSDRFSYTTVEEMEAVWAELDTEIRWNVTANADWVGLGRIEAIEASQIEVEASKAQ